MNPALARATKWVRFVERPDGASLCGLIHIIEATVVDANFR
jgi:hypothetical protein